MTWTIYAHTSPEGKTYVGRTTQSITARSGSSGTRYRANNLFYEDICRFGWNNFLHEELAICETEEAACHLEMYYIKAFCALIGEHGYNISVGGNGNNKGLTKQQRKERLRICSERWKREHREKYLDHRRTYDRSEKRKAQANARNKTPKRRAHRTEYMRKYREEHRDELNAKRREKAARDRADRGHKTAS